KPIILMQPKSLPPRKPAVSPMDQFTTGNFVEVFDDERVDPAQVRRVLLCSGKIYYELREQRAKQQTEEVAIIRVEQFYPFPAELLRRGLSRYRKAKEWVWVQEESMNMGGWTFMEPRLRSLGWAVAYVGRDESASPATGSRRVHLAEQRDLVDAAIGGPVPHSVRATPDGRRSATSGDG